MKKSVSSRKEWSYEYISALWCKKDEFWGLNIGCSNIYSLNFDKLMWWMDRVRGRLQEYDKRGIFYTENWRHSLESWSQGEQKWAVSAGDMVSRRFLLLCFLKIVNMAGLYANRTNPVEEKKWCREEQDIAGAIDMA